MQVKYGVYRLDIHKPPGWFLLRSYDSVDDAIIYCTMLNQDTTMFHKVFEYDE